MKRDWTEANEKVRDEGRRRYCGRWSGPIDPAHIIPRSRGGDMTADAIIPLCRKHHTAYDSGSLEILGLLTRAEQTHAVSLVGVAEVYRRTTV